jgi:hypothetical protein
MTYQRLPDLRREHVPFRLAIISASVPGPAIVAEDAELPGSEEPILVADAACELLQERGTLFVAGGFGDPAWKVDVCTDLAVIIPQLGDFTHALTVREHGELACYEQGVERIVFAVPDPTGELVSLRCESYGDWVPPQPEETATLAVLLAMVRGFERDVAAEVRAAWPALAALAPFPEWLDDSV